MSIALITSIYGGYDRLGEAPDLPGVECIAVLDRYDGLAHGWRQVIEPRPHMHPRLAAKVAKCRPDLYTGAEYVIWVDGHATIKRSDFAEWCVAGVGDEAIAQFMHPERTCLYEEVLASKAFPKYHGQNMDEQVAHYRAQGMPELWGLWATGVIVRRLEGRGQPYSSSAVNRILGDKWLVQQMRWTYQDQLSLPFIYWAVGMRPATLPGNLWNNPYVGFVHGHKGDT